MGSGASKSAAQSTIRRFPNRAPGSAAAPPPLPHHTSAGAQAEQAASRTDAAAQAAPDQARCRGHPAAPISREDASREAGRGPPPAAPDTTLPPGLARRLRAIGAVQPHPTYSPSSTALPAAAAAAAPVPYGQRGGPASPAAAQNAVLAALEARRRVQEEADHEFEQLGRCGGPGRRFLPAGMIRDVLVLRERGATEAQIEHRFNLKKDVVQRLGPKELYKPSVSGELLAV